MRNQLLGLLIPALIITAFSLQSCGNLDVVKRRYRPGFHVDVKTKASKVEKNKERAQMHTQIIEKLQPKQAELEPSLTQTDELADFTASTSAAASTFNSQKKLTAKKINDFMLTPVREIKREKLNSELKRAVFNKDEEEKYGWSVISFISTGLGVLGLGFLITGIVLLAGAIFGSGFAFWWLFLLIGLLIGVAAMVTGIIGLRQTGSGEKRGRGFALGGMIAGIVSLAGALIGLFWGLIYSIITGFSGDDF